MLLKRKRDRKCSTWRMRRRFAAVLKRGSGKHMFGLSLFRPTRQSNISTSGEERFKYPFPRENKISQMPYPRDNKDNQIPTPCPASPPRRHYIDRCIMPVLVVCSTYLQINMTCFLCYFSKAAKTPQHLQSVLSIFSYFVTTSS